MHAIQTLLIIVISTVSMWGQAWSGLLKPTYGTGACTYGSISAPGQCAIDWTAVGIPGGVPSGTWTQHGATLTPSGGDDTSAIQASLNACGTNHYVLLGIGNFKIGGNLQVPSHCVLRGSGPQNTILTASGTSGAVVHMGTVGDLPYANGTAQVTGGATAGSTSITVSGTTINSSSTSLTACSGASSCLGFLVLSELNDAVYVSQSTIQDGTTSCGYCDGSWSGTRLRGQIVEITNVTGTGPYTVTFDPPLYSNYGTATGTGPVYATPMGVICNACADAMYAGVEQLQIYGTGTGIASGMTSIEMAECAYCWVVGNEINYTDADFVRDEWGFRDEIRDNYFSNAFGHGSGTSDNDLQIWYKTSGTLIQNNIVERGHCSIIVDLGAAGNVIAYNYAVDSFDAVGYNSNQIDFALHGPQPQFNLYEGNVAQNFYPDAFHGSSAYQTVFRNWFTASSTVASYPSQSINNISCSGGTCTVTWSSVPSTFYAGEYIYIAGNSGTCNSVNGGNYRLSGTAGQLSSSFSASCTGGTGGSAFTFDLSALPAPITHQPIDWTNTHTTTQSMWSSPIAYLSTNNYMLGNVMGSSQASTTVGTGNLYNGAAAPCTSCGQPATNRPYSGEYFAFTFGYDTGGDSSGSAVATFPAGPSNTAGYWVGKAFGSAFLHGNWDMASGSTIWNVNATAPTSLPASFYLSGKPAWFGSVPFPAIGPDVTGGPDSIVGGHAYYNPAAVCYNSLPRDSAGVKQFNAATCYGSSTPSGTSIAGSITTAGPVTKH